MADLSRFLIPVSPDRPSGIDLRLVAGDLTFSTLDEMRREVDPRLDLGGEAKSADWRGVSLLCEKLLTEKTKDLQLAAIYTQALVRQHGFEGLDTGLRLVHGLLEAFWDTLYPGCDEQEIVEPIRARPLSWLGSSRDFLAAVKRVPLSEPVGGTPRCWFDYEQAQRLDSASLKSDRSKHNELLEMGLVTTAACYDSVAATPAERLAATLSRLQSCQDALAELSALCAAKFRESGPYFGDLSGLFDDMREFLVGAAPAPVAAPAAVADAAGGDAVTASGGGAAADAGPIASRDDAYRRVREVAEFLRRTEPHSPVPALLDRAVRWGGMSFESLFDDVVKNNDVRVQTKDLLGLSRPQD
ncbi:MAG: type VI secretion system protein TssA [bacterium]|nr:type VI secretion system protein TssA [bacterium]